MLIVLFFSVFFFLRMLLMCFIGMLAVVMVMLLDEGGFDMLHQCDDLHLRGIEGIKKGGRPDLGFSADPQEHVTAGNLCNVHRGRLVVVHFLTGGKEEGHIRIFSGNGTGKIVLRKHGGNDLYAFVRPCILHLTAGAAEEHAGGQKGGEPPHRCASRQLSQMP